jgi:hypothetical protein
VVEKQLGQQAQVLAVELLNGAIDLPQTQVALAVDLVAWWVPQLAPDLGGRAMMRERERREREQREERAERGERERERERERKPVGRRRGRRGE